MKRDLKVVGHNVARVDAIDKVTGKAKFVGDLVIPGMLCGQILRSPYPHARIVSIDASEAEALDGVAGVLTAKDVADLDPYYNGRPLFFPFGPYGGQKRTCAHKDPVEKVLKTRRKGKSLVPWYASQPVTF